MAISSPNERGGIVVRGTGELSLDDALFADAVAVLNNRVGGGTIWIDGELRLQSYHNFTEPVSIRGLGRGAGVIWFTSSSNLWRWNGNFNIAAQAGYAASTSQEFSQKVDYTPGAWTPAIGDWFLIESDDDLAGVPPHFIGGSQRGMELHQVQHWIAADGEIALSDYVRDQMTTNAKVIPLDGTAGNLTMMQDIVVDNLWFEYGDDPEDQADYTSALYFQGCVNVTCENLHFRRHGPGALSFNYCANSKVCGLVLEGAAKQDDVYGITAGVVNGLIISDFRVDNTRHVFTTTSGKASGLVRWGTPRNVLLQNGLVFGGLKYSPASGFGSSRIMLDTHPEGWGIEFRDIVISNVGDPKFDSLLSVNSNTAMQSRSRGTVFRDCRIQGTRTGLGVAIYADDCKVVGCLFDQCWKGVRVLASASGIAADDLLVDRCVFTGLLDSGVYHEVGNRTTITNCTFRDVGQLAPAGGSGGGSSTRSSTCVDLVDATYTGHRLHGNIMPKYSNDGSVHLGDSGGNFGTGDVAFHGNTCTGYGVNSLGINGGASYGSQDSNASAFEAAVLSMNFHD